jgi:hypothetical protein
VIRRTQISRSKPYSDNGPIREGNTDRLRMRAMARYALLRKFVLCAIIAFGAAAIAPQPASAGISAQAEAVANQGLDGCATYTGKQLRDCVAGVLDRIADTSPFPSVVRALRTAAAGVRAAANKAQALSAIAACQAVVASAFKLARTSGSSPQGILDGWDRLTRVLARAASLVQAKG